VSVPHKYSHHENTTTRKGWHHILLGKTRTIIKVRIMIIFRCCININQSFTLNRSHISTSHTISQFSIKYKCHHLNAYGPILWPIWMWYYTYSSFLPELCYWTLIIIIIPSSLHLLFPRLNPKCMMETDSTSNTRLHIINNSHINARLSYYAQRQDNISSSFLIIIIDKHHNYNMDIIILIINIM
jgi:hypothetical protein